MGGTIVILNDKDAAFELMEKMAIKNSSRPHMEFCFGMCGYNRFATGMPYDDTLRRHRKLIHQYIGTSASVIALRKVQEREISRTLLRLLETPERLIEHVRTQVGATVIELTYGYSMETKQPDPVLQLVSRWVDIFCATVIPGKWLVDLFPFMKHLPSWFPGAGFQDIARRWRKEVFAAADVPFQFAKIQWENNSNRPSFVSYSLDRAGDDIDPELESDINLSAANLYGAASDTTVSTLSFAYLALIKHPDILRKAQKEIDEVVGSERLPTFEDRAKLVYLESVIKEAYRWHPTAPIDSILLPNAWWYAHDPNRYHEPERFNPERFLAPYNEPDPKEYVFGIGRRICPGKTFADANIWLTIAQTIAVFDVLKAVDEHGVPVEPIVQPITELVTHPAKFPFQIKPRSQKHKEMIRRIAQPSASEKSDLELLEQLGVLNK
uniref:O-methylsterigmatocystin oxidoreductase n=1 Tax=Bionectria ochroleuca TaxID=29856 RepID=A0A8H7NBU0_BIOOC